MPLARFFLRRPLSGSDKRRPPLPILLPLLIGATFLVGAVIQMQPALQFLLNASHAEARYIGAIKDRPRFRFTTANGTIVMFTDRSGSAQGRRDGDTATVHYDPARPADARLLDSWQEWRSAIVLAAIGLLSIAVGVVVVRRWRRRAA